MKSKLTQFLLCLFLLGGLACAAQPTYDWAFKAGSTVSDGSRRLATDASGNIYMTGYFSNTVDFDPGAGTANLVSGGNSDIFVAKYDASGNYLWAFKVGGSGQDIGDDIALDNSGNVLVTGTFRNTADFDPSGSTANLTSSGDFEAFVAKYDASGNYLWAFKIGKTSLDRGYGIASNESDNVYVTGTFSSSSVDFDPGGGTANLSSSGGKDIFVAKYSSAGNYLWAFKIGGTSDDRGYYISVDGNNILVTGIFQNTADFDPGGGIANLTSSGGTDAFVAKYDDSGNYQWAFKLGSTSNDGGISVIPDASGNVLVHGYFQNTADFDPGGGTANLTSNGDYDIFLAKYDASANYIWAFNIGAAGPDVGRVVATDASGDLWITGYFQNTADFDPGGGTANHTSNGAYDVYVAKYDDAGNYLCSFSIGGSGSDLGFDINTEGISNLFIAGAFQNTADFDPGAGTANLTSSGNYDIFAAKYDDNCPIGLPIELLSFDAKNEGETVKTFWSTASETNNDYFTIERSVDGATFEGIGTVAGAGNSSTTLSYSFVDRNPFSPISYYRLKQTDFDGKFGYSAIIAIEYWGDSELIVSDVYPNPAENKLHIDLNSKSDIPVQISINDIVGRQVMFMKNTTSPGFNNLTVDLSRLAKGLYHIKIFNNFEVIHISKFIKK